MKIFIATFYKNNYGSALQAVALQQKLRELGGEPEIIGIRPKQEKINLKERITLFFRPEKHYGIIRKLRRGFQRKIYREKAKKINEFVKQHAIVRDFEDCISEIEEKGGILLAGSDQVWSTLNHPIDSFYLFDYVNNQNVKKVSYAASIGISDVDPEHIEYYVNTLKDFDVVSFRERVAYDALSRHLKNKIVRQDIDPTLLYTGEFWGKLTSEKLYDKSYVFIYMLRPSTKVIQVARKIAKEKQLDIIYMGLYVNKYRGIKTVSDAGIEDFLSYIQHADVVVTNSFHGTVFSLLFEKKFVSMKIESTSSRVENLLSLAGLQNHLISEIEDYFIAFEDYDIPNVQNKLECLRNDSTRYLQSIVNDAFRGDYK